VALAIGFWILAAVAVGAALAVVILRDVFRAALTLVLCLVAVAGIYITLSADFLAGAQVLVYVGAISILLILGIMLTRDVQQGSSSNKFRLPAFFIAIAFLGIMSFVMLNTNWHVSAVAPVTPSTPTLATNLFAENGFILPVEISGVLLLAAIVGAITIAREK
jgi:NADH-quinone oxidoreductase subunit J